MPGVPSWLQCRCREQENGMLCSGLAAPACSWCPCPLPPRSFATAWATCWAAPPAPCGAPAPCSSETTLGSGWPPAGCTRTAAGASRRAACIHCKSMLRTGAAASAILCLILLHHKPPVLPQRRRRRGGRARGRCGDQGAHPSRCPRTHLPAHVPLVRMLCCAVLCWGCCQWRRKHICSCKCAGQLYGMRSSTVRRAGAHCHTG